MTEIVMDWEIVKWIVIYGGAIVAIYFTSAVVVSKNILRQIAVVLDKYGDGFNTLADALEDNTVTEEEYEKIFNEFKEAYGESGKLYQMIKEAIPYQWLMKIFRVG